MASSPKPIPPRALGHAPADKRIDILKQVAAIVLALVFSIRMLAIYRGWNLPSITLRPR